MRVVATIIITNICWEQNKEHSVWNMIDELTNVENNHHLGLHGSSDYRRASGHDQIPNTIRGYLYDGEEASNNS